MTSCMYILTYIKDALDKPAWDYMPGARQHISSGLSIDCILISMAVHIGQEQV